MNRIVVHRGTTAIAASLLLCVAILVGGCSPVGAIAYAAFGEPPVDPEYELHRVPTLVFVENYVNPDASSDDSNVLSRYIVANLKEHFDKDKKKNKGKKPPLKLIDPMDLYNLRTAEPAKFHHMKIQEIGRKLGAKQVIYVSMDSLDVQEVGAANMIRGTGTARVKVISSATGQTLWPQESSGGYPVAFKSKLITPQQNITVGEVRDRTMQRMGRDIARLFYKWNPEDDDDDINF